MVNRGGRLARASLGAIRKTLGLAVDSEFAAAQRIVRMCCKLENMRSKNLGWYRSHGCGHPEETLHEADLIHNRSLQ
jgi:hypothetical protein